MLHQSGDVVFREPIGGRDALAEAYERGDLVLGQIRRDGPSMKLLDHVGDLARRAVLVCGELVPERHRPTTGHDRLADIEGLNGLDTVAVEPPGDEDLGTLPSPGRVVRSGRSPVPGGGRSGSLSPARDDCCVGVVDSYLAGRFDKRLTDSWTHPCDRRRPMTCSSKSAASASKSAAPLSALANDGLPMMPVSV